MNEQEYKNKINRDMATISLLMEQFDAADSAAVVSLRDQTGQIMDIYCGNPKMIMACYASIVNDITIPNSLMTEYDLQDSVNYFLEKKSQTESQQITDASESPDNSTYEPQSLAKIEDVLEQYKDENEAWVVGFCVTGRANFMNGIFHGKHGASELQLEAVSASIARFISNCQCPYCECEVDYDHFMEHVKSILNSMVCIRKREE